ncbi:MAG: SiaC family regulatory phosphoprotein, partial [Bacteroidales bacterium]|nr:SiaC family regulatory phosphoprotein [Bacteroidales bacterium]
SPGQLVIELEFSILSSASNKMVYEMLVKLEKIFYLGKSMEIKWIYEGFDEDMVDEGLGYKANLKIDFELVEK